MTESLRARLEVQAEKHEIRGKDFEHLIEWAETISFHAGMLQNIELGFIEVTGMIAPGNPKFSITPEGSKYVEGMPYK